MNGESTLPKLRRSGFKKESAECLARVALHEKARRTGVGERACMIWYLEFKTSWPS